MTATFDGGGSIRADGSLVGRMSPDRRIAGSDDQTRCLAAHPSAANRGQFDACRLMLRDLEGGARTEADHVRGDLLHRQTDSDIASPSLLRMAYLHLKTDEARRAREGIPPASA
jgi:ketopantoate reductase